MVDNVKVGILTVIIVEVDILMVGNVKVGENT
jgi:hypothetical protein